MNSHGEASSGEGCCKSLNNREIVALTPPLTDTCQLKMVKLPHSLNPSSSKAPSVTDCVMKRTKVPFRLCVSLATKQTLRITA
jgi:hypothetical protein